MQTVDGTAGSATTWAELPAVIKTYLTAHGARDVETALSTFAGDAVVIDDGRTHRGHAEIRSWLADAGGGYTFTTEFAGATRVDEAHVDVLQHLEGDFPGGVVDLHHRFTVNGPSIAHLVIEP